MTQMMPIVNTFEQRALPLIGRNIPVAPVQPREKACKLPGWEQLATTNLQTIQQWDKQNPDFNTAAVARAEIGGFCFFEVDAPNYHEVIEQQTGQKFPETLLISSSPNQGRGHFYFRHTPKSIAFQKQCGKAYVSGKDADGKEAYSFRMHNAYVVGPDSIKPDGVIYTVINKADVAECPDWLIDYVSNSTARPSAPSALPEQVNVSPDGPKIPHGSHDNELTRIGGKLRQDGLEEEAIYTALVEVCEKRCVSYGSDYLQMIRKIAHSVARYPVTPPATPVIINGHVAGQAPAPEQDLSWLDLNEVAARPVFPAWVMADTSLYTGLAKPVTDVNSKFPELIWLPAVQLMLNYLHNKVGIAGIKIHTNMFLGIISSPGKFFKSSSCKLAHAYFQQMEYAKPLSPGLKNSDGKVVVGQAGSSEGFGLQMYNANAKHGIMFNPELGKLTAKVGIENSSLAHDLLAWYESEDFANIIKSTKMSFAFPAETYCFGWQFCTTTRGFNSQWPRIAGVASGMADRFFFVVTPEEPKELTGEVFVNTTEGAMYTKALIMKAMNGYVDAAVSPDKKSRRHEYEIDEEAADMLLKKSAAFGDPRSMNMVYKFALYFAIDLGLESINDDCIRRALALVEYRQQTIAYLQPIEAGNDEGRVLQEMIREIRQHGGKMNKREFLQNLNASYYGDRFWNTVYCGAIKADHFREFTEPGLRGQTRRMVGLVNDDVRLGPE